MANLFVDLLGCELSQEEAELLAHPTTAGVILFSRNYADREQLCELIRRVRASRSAPLLITVDHEGGRVQRFREEFSPIPAMGMIQQLAEPTDQTAEQLALMMGWLMAAELRACDIDMSFAPVLDLNGPSEVIGHRAFSAEPNEVIPLARALCKGMAQAGMKNCGKHFPGHGSVQADTHYHAAIDQRSFEQIRQSDLQPFQQLIAEGCLDSVMPAHVIYQQVDEHSAGFSLFWLQKQLRQRLGFKGLIFSDDLSMEGAAQGKSYTERAIQALDAGVQLLLACNNRDATIELLDNLPQSQSNPSEQLLAKAYPATWRELAERSDYRQAKKLATELHAIAGIPA